MTRTRRSRRTPGRAATRTFVGVSRISRPEFREHPVWCGAGGNRTLVRRAVTDRATTIPEIADLRLPHRRVGGARAHRRVFPRCQRSFPPSAVFAAVILCFCCRAAVDRPRVPSRVAMTLDHLMDQAARAKSPSALLFGAPFRSLSNSGRTSDSRSRRRNRSAPCDVGSKCTGRAVVVRRRGIRGRATARGEHRRGDRSSNPSRPLTRTSEARCRTASEGSPCSGCSCSTAACRGRRADSSVSTRSSSSAAS